jgi:nitrite reductase/ring-hydroxylating ferredoxin subunit
MREHGPILDGQYKGVPFSLRVLILKFATKKIHWSPNNPYIAYPIYSLLKIPLPIEVAKLDEIPAGKMKNVRAFDQDILLSNVDGKLYATQNRCGHQNAPLHRGTLEGNVVTCPLHAAQFDVMSGRSLRGPQPMMSQEIIQKMPQEMLVMLKKTSEILSEIQIEPLKTFKVNVEGNSVFLEEG